MTDQRNRLTTDPGLGPIEFEHPSTLRSIAAAEPIAESPGAPVYYEPKPLNAVSEHKTLELQTVKISNDIDPRKLPTELKLRRPVLHVLPASDPNWPAPVPQFDSSWPPPETVVTTSQPPHAARGRSLVPLLLLVFLGATFLLVLGMNIRRHSLFFARPDHAATPAAAAVPKQVEALPITPVASATSDSAASAAAASTPIPTSEPESAANSPAADATASAASATPTAPARLADNPHRANVKPAPASLANSNGRTLSAPSPVKPKRAIY